ncbi:MAG: hypothetical protein JNG90_10360 [Planctomycetaceae bacterium]|nr:hypothetical protein [Planctomycetaceae bacterium]
MAVPWQQALEQLRRRYGRAPEPRGATALERALVVIAQRQSAASAAQLIEQLRRADLLDLHALAETSAAELAELLPGAARGKLARRLGDFARSVVDESAGSLEEFFALETTALRGRLQRIAGLGPETIELLLLVAGGRPVVPISTACHRVGVRHGWLTPGEDRETLRAELASPGLESADDCYQFHAWLQRVGQEFCRAEPLCGECPLRDLLPAGGPWELE